MKSNRTVSKEPEQRTRVATLYITVFELLKYCTVFFENTRENTIFAVLDTCVCLSYTSLMYDTDAGFFTTKI